MDIKEDLETLQQFSAFCQDQDIVDAIKNVLAWHEERDKVNLIDCKNCQYEETSKPELCFACINSGDMEHFKLKEELTIEAGISVSCTNSEKK